MSMTNTDWHNRPYYTLDAWCKNQFHYKCYKVALNAHMNCPNRDGSIGTRGCIFCSEGGSGEFAVDIRGLDIQKQLNEGIRRIAGKLPDTSFEKPCIIAYFQAYTNTYAPLPYLKEVFTEALSCPMVLGISVGTRPDCLPGFSNAVSCGATKAASRLTNSLLFFGVTNRADCTASISNLTSGASK